MLPLSDMFSSKINIFTPPPEVKRYFFAHIIKGMLFWDTFINGSTCCHAFHSIHNDNNNKVKVSLSDIPAVLLKHSDVERPIVALPCAWSDI